MSKFITTTAFAAIIAASAPLAYAQTAAPSPVTPPAERATAPGMTGAPRADANQDSFTTTDGKLRAAEIIGSTVYDEQNQNVGSVKDVLLDHGGKVQSVVLDVGAFLGMGGKYVTVSLNDLKTDNNRLTLNQTKDQLKSAPEFHFRTR